MASPNGGGPDPNWHATLALAQLLAYGDPVTGGVYRLRGNTYELHENGEVTVIGDQVAIAFDAETRMVITHGSPEAIDEFGSKARLAYSEREDDINQLPATLVIIHMPKGFSEDDINLSLADPMHLAKIVGSAVRNRTLTSGEPKALPGGDPKALPAPDSE